jgi:hypothetical protein
MLWLMVAECCWCELNAAGSRAAMVKFRPFSNSLATSRVAMFFLECGNMSPFSDGQTYLPVKYPACPRIPNCDIPRCAFGLTLATCIATTLGNIKKWTQAAHEKITQAKVSSDSRQTQR